MMENLLDSQSVQIQDSIDILRRALVKETVVGGNDIAVLPPDFYKQVKLGMTGTGDDLEVLKLFERITGIRLKKIQTRAVFGPLNEELESRLTPEERELYSTFHDTCRTFKDNVIKGELL